MLSTACRLTVVSATLMMGACLAGPGFAQQSVMQQCGQQYQAAKAAGTLNGMNWNQFRTDCAAKLKATPAAATAAEPATAQPAAAAPVDPLKPAAAPAPAAPAPAATAAASAPAPAAAPAGTAAAPAKPVSAGRAAFVARERQCGSEWKAGKASLIAQTPGLTWPKYLSQCNARLKAAGK